MIDLIEIKKVIKEKGMTYREIKAERSRHEKNI